METNSTEKCKTTSTKKWKTTSKNIKDDHQKNNENNLKKKWKTTSKKINLFLIPLEFRAKLSWGWLSSLALYGIYGDKHYNRYKE
jgi:hypothetical protein